jgi:hypothetical protein
MLVTFLSSRKARAQTSGCPTQSAAALAKLSGVLKPT